MDKQNVIKAIFWTKTKVRAAVCAALVAVIGGASFAQEAAKPPPAKNIVQVATDGTGDYKTDGTDDHVEINQALQDIHKKGGGTVHLKKGTYVIDNSVVIHANTILEGDGWTTVITVKDDGAYDWPKGRHMVINGKGTINVTIRNLKIDGKRDKYMQRSGGKEGWGGGFQVGISLGGVSNATLSGLWIGNNRCDQITLGRCKNITIQDCTLEDGGHDCVYSYCCENVKVLNCRMGIRCNCGVRLYSTNPALVKGNIMHPVLLPVEGKGGNGIQIQWNDGKMDDILIEDNVIFAVAGQGISTTTDGPPPSPFGKIVIRNNIFYHCRGGGIKPSNYDMVIENNTIYNNKHYGIGFWSRRPLVTFPVTVTVRSNIITNNSGPGLTTSGQSNVRILSSHNNVWNNSGGNYVGSNVKSKNDISVDPLFVKTDVPFTHGMPVQLKMDLHLKSQHGRWNKTKSTWVKDDVTSPCIDAGNPSFAYSKEPDPNGRRINLGGYGNTKNASKSTGMARGAITGKITDKTTGKPISGASVSTGGYFGTTDTAGNYTILDVPAGEYSLKVSAIKYVEQVRDSIKVSKDGKTVVGLALVKEKVPPTVKSHSPAGKNPIGKIISVVFSEPMNVRSAEKSFSVTPSATGSFRWIGSTMYFIPDAPLKYGTEYKITIDGAEDLAGNKLKSPHVWEFSTLGQAEHLVGEWRFEEESGDTAKDSSGRDNHGALKGKPTRVEGKIGKALSLDGVDDLVEVPHSDSLVAREEITIEAWVKPDKQIKTGGHHLGLVGKFHRHKGYEGYHLVSYSHRGVVIPSIGYHGKRKEMGTRFGPQMASGAWTFLTATRDFQGNVKCYVNAKQTKSVKTDPIEDVIVDRGSRGPGSIWIGWYIHGGKFKGIIDEVRIYNRALSPAEIKADFERTK